MYDSALSPREPYVEDMDMQTALITGASGFVGTALTRVLSRLGVRAVSVPAASRDHPRDERSQSLFDRLVGSLRRERVNVIFHLAGSGVPDFGLDNVARQYAANIGPVDALASAVEVSGFSGPVVFASSAAVYGSTGIHPVTEDAQVSPCNAYGQAKAEAERLLWDRLGGRCSLRIARIFHLFGPGQRKLVVYDLAKRLVRGERPLTIRGTGEETRDFVFIDDAADALAFLGLDSCHQDRSFVINVSTGVPTRIFDLAHVLIHLGEVQSYGLSFIPPERPNPIVACVGDSQRLHTLGHVLPPISHARLAQTLMWVRGDSY